MRIVVAMSGGVDSATAAGLLVEAGHEVIGLSMKTHGLEPRANRACCTPDDMRDARYIADLLDIPFYVLNYEHVFADAVIKPFVQAYQNGQTPNPCVECNDKVKFVPLLERAKLLGADLLATGHYARIVAHPTFSQYKALARAVDARKDQSYFLYRLQQAQLAQLMFPLGEMTKDQVRAHARRLGLPVADKSESQEICFVGAEGYAATVEKLAGVPNRSGPIVDMQGRVLGQHQGIHHFTIGQRRGLGVAAARPLYVTRIDAEAGVVYVGEQQELLTQSVSLENVVWSCGTPPACGTLVLVQQRYRQSPQEAVIAEIEDDSQKTCIRLQFLHPESRTAPGQAAVLYDGDVVIGGGAVAGNDKTARHPAAKRLQVLA